MATKNELVQAINSAFSGEQQRVLQALLNLATTPPVATATTLGVVKVGAGITVAADGKITVP